jgi:hypothetical protein
MHTLQSRHGGYSQRLSACIVPPVGPGCPSKSLLLLNLDLAELGQRSFNQNFAYRCRCFCPVSLSKGEDAVVTQISHHRLIGDFIVCQLARPESGLGRTRDNLDEFASESPCVRHLRLASKNPTTRCPSEVISSAADSGQRFSSAAVR